jgi:hypothetical protein
MWTPHRILLSIFPSILLSLFLSIFQFFYEIIFPIQTPFPFAQVTFHLEPYFLRISLPFPCVEDGRETAEYDRDTGFLKLLVPKLNQGQEFPDLDMVTKLLANKSSQGAPKIEVPFVGRRG